jgi:hypothetical protein
MPADEYFQSKHIALKETVKCRIRGNNVYLCDWLYTTGWIPLKLVDMYHVLDEPAGSVQGRRVESDTSHKTITLTLTAMRTSTFTKLSPTGKLLYTMSSVTGFFQNNGTTMRTSNLTSNSYSEFMRTALQLMSPITCVWNDNPSLQISKPDKTYSLPTFISHFLDLIVSLLFLKYPLHAAHLQTATFFKVFSVLEYVNLHWTFNP